MQQLKLLLWKNWTLRKRRPVATAIEVFVPLILFLILAAVRQRRPALDVEAITYNTLALTSAGPIPLLQTFFCGRVSVLDDTPSSPLDQVAAILTEANVSPQRVINLMRNISRDLQDLNTTLYSIRLGDIPASSQIQTIINNLPNVTDFNTTVQDASLTAPQVDRGNVRAACSYLRSVQFRTVRDLISISPANSSNNQVSAGDNTLDIGLIRNSSNPLDELIKQVRNMPTFVNTTVPRVLTQLNETFPDVALNSSDIAGVQDIFNNFTTSNNTVLRAQLLAFLEPRSPQAAGVVAALIGLSTVQQTTDALRDLANSTTSPTITVPQSDVPLLQTQLDRIQQDIADINALQLTYERIIALPGVQQLFDNLNSALPSTSALTDFICPNSSATGSALNGIPSLRRRSAEARHDEQSAGEAKAWHGGVDISSSGPNDAREAATSLLETLVSYFAPDRRVRRADTTNATSPTSAPARTEYKRSATQQLVLDLVSQMKIYYAPDVQPVRDVIKQANRTFENVATLTELANCVVDAANNATPGTSDLGNFNLDVFVGFPTEYDMVADAMNQPLTKVLGGIVFYDGAENKSLWQPDGRVRLGIRMSEYKVPNTANTQSRTYRPGPGGNAGFLYYYSGFALIQDMIERALVDLRADEHLSDPASFAQQFPVPAYRSDDFSFGISRTMPLLMTLAWIYTVSIIVKDIVYEKEYRLKEYMKMMGLANRTHWIAWFITSFILMTITVVLLTLILFGSKTFRFSSPMLVFAILEVFGIATIVLSFLISVFFSKARLAAACAGIIYFLSYMPYIFVNIQVETLTRSQKLAASLSSTTAFGIAVDYIGKAESSGEGLSFANYARGDNPCDNFNARAAIWMMILDTFIYAVIAWYVETVWPGDYGVPRPWYFLFQRSYWCGKRNVAPPSAAAYQDTTESSDALEAVPSGPRGIDIRGLTKVYEDEGLNLCSTSQPRKAVDNLTLQMLESQITSLLGHNGAGKTTTMSIITGLFPPTSGTAFVGPYNIATDMDEIHHHLGICPQYNVLFPRLTVAEHLWFFASLKGVARDTIPSDTTKYLTDLGLEDKRHVWSEALSGGMKRKLSVAIAFIGDSKTVILDEPTAGMDPSARRSTWDILLKYKTGRTIMLSTHHMDEADLLSDRIAIIARGRLRCAGSPLFLKRRFGAGYRVTLVLGEHAASDAALGDFLTRHVPETELVDNAGNERSFLLPHTAVAAFPVLFRELDASLATLGVLSYGLTATSLEEVFLRVAEEAEVEAVEVEEAQALAEAHVASMPLWSRLTRQSPGRASTSSRRGLMEDDLELRSIADEQELGKGKAAGDIGRARARRTMRDDMTVPGQVDRSTTNTPTLMDGHSLRSMDAVSQDAISTHSELLQDGYIEVEGDAQSDGQPAAPLASESDTDTPASTSTPAHDESARTSVRTGLKLTPKPPTGTLVHGVKLRLQRFRALITKRLQYAMHDRRAVFSMIILPAFFVCGGMLVATAFPPPSDLPPRIMTLDAVSQVCDAIRETSHVPYANREKSDAANALENAAFKYTTDVYINLSQVPAYLHPSGSCGADCSWPRNMTSYLLDTAKTEERTRRTAVDVVGLRPSVISLSATTLDLDPMGANLFFDNRAYHSLPVSINLMNNALLRTVTGSTPAFIETTNHPLNRTAARKTESYLRSGTDLTVAINVIIALSFVPASFVVFLVHERVTKSKHLQFVSGVEPGTYWLANYVWDLCNYLVPAFICIFVFLAFGLPAYTGRNFPTVIALVLLYGAAITPLMYPSNWIFNVPSTAYISLICINLFIGLTATLATFVLELFPDDPELQDVNDVLRWLFLIFPNYCLGRGLMDLARNEYIAEYSELAAEITGSTSRGFTSPFTWKLVGRNLVFLAIEAVVFLAMTYVIELIKSSRTARKEQTRPSPIALAGEDSDVIAERKRVENETDDLLRVRNLTKIYKSRGKLKVAVNQLTFGVPHGQCFGLLGVNGAGKTSTFQMLTNDLSLTSGDAWIDGYSVVDHVLEVRQRMGYCPQFDALSELLTGRQTLMMYARIHGIPEERVHDVVEWAVQHLQLGPWADRLVRGYSGGNRRKLSVAVAIAVSDAPIIFLDEPTSGMDPKARRFLWDLITTTVRSGRSVVLTSHSMEECDALCTRLAIMVNGAFRCLGSPQHIKTRYGDGYTLIIKVTGSTPDVAPVQGYIQSVFPHAVLKECHHGYLRYQLPARDMPPMADVFSALERAKETLPVEDYSLSQTSLDEIFCNFAAEQHTDRNDAVLPITGSTSVSQA